MRLPSTVIRSSGNEPRARSVRDRVRGARPARGRLRLRQQQRGDRGDRGVLLDEVDLVLETAMRRVAKLMASSRRPSSMRPTTVCSSFAIRAPGPRASTSERTVASSRTQSPRVPCGRAAWSRWPSRGRCGGAVRRPTTRTRSPTTCTPSAVPAAPGEHGPQIAVGTRSSNAAAHRIPRGARGADGLVVDELDASLRIDDDDPLADRAEHRLLVVVEERREARWSSPRVCRRTRRERTPVAKPRRAAARRARRCRRRAAARGPGRRSWSRGRRRRRVR